MKNELSAISQTESTEIKKTPLAGEGGCRACSCKGFVPNNPKNNYCKNCEHHYDRHV